MKIAHWLASAASLATALALTAAPAHANVIWDWSFSGEQGTFTTDGTAGVPGTYAMLDFAVTNSAAGRPVGSLSGGQYSASGFSTDPPYSFVYDGTAVTQWLQSGSNSFDWWVFTNAANTNEFHFFGWNVGNTNDPTSAALYRLNPTRVQSIGSVSVTFASVDVGAVPEPSTWAMMLLGFGFVGGAMRTAKRREKVTVSYA